jgi:glycerophosphoryl diester phosphodiesterase
VERVLADTLHRRGLAGGDSDAPIRVTVMSFSLLALRRIRALAPGVPTVLLLDIVPPGLRGGHLPTGTHIGGPSVHLMRAHPGLVRRLHARGHRVYVWTVNEPADLDLARDLGVDGVISDRPQFARDRFARDRFARDRFARDRFDLA